MITAFRLLCSLSLVLLFASTSIAQRPTWRSFDIGDTIHALADEDEFLWIATRNEGLVKMRKSSGQMAFFGKSFGLRSNYVFDVLVDEVQIVWAATTGGLAVLGGTETLTFHKGNSDLPNDTIRAMEFGDRAIWLGTWNGLARFDGENWEVYNTDNSDLPDNQIRSLAVVDSTLWVGTQNGGLARLDTGQWIVYDTLSSPLKHNSVWSLFADQDGSLWIATATGLQHLDGSNWTDYPPGANSLNSQWINGADRGSESGLWLATHHGLNRYWDGSWSNYNSSNSDLTGNIIDAVMVDSLGDVWIGLFNGELAVHNPDGLHALAPGRIKHTINPNPFTIRTMLEIQNQTAYEGTYSIYFWDVMGREVGKIENFSDHQLYLGAFGFPPGVILYKLIKEDGELGYGKILVTTFSN